MYENGKISADIDNNIATIEFYHPKGNSLPGNLLRQIARTISDTGSNDDVKVIILKSRGDGAFCAGASFDELIAIDNREQGKQYFMGFARVLNAMRKCSKLIIVRVQGKAVGGGVGIAAAGDYTIAHSKAAIKLSELALGIGPFVVGPAVTHQIGAAAFSTLTIDATSWNSAAWALDKGLYAKLCDSVGQLDDTVETLAQKLSDYNPEAMTALKGVFWEGTDHWDTLMEERAEMSGKLVLSDFTKKFIRDFKNSK